MEALQLFSEAVTLILTDSAGLWTQYGHLIQGHSRLHIEAEVVCPEGTELSRVTMVCGGVSAFGTDLTFGLPNAGTVAVTVTAAFSDGQTETKETAVQVLPYSPPEVKILGCERCNSMGQPDTEGQLGLVTFESSISDLPGGNTAAYSLQYRASTSGDWRSIPLTGLPQGSIASASAMFPADASCDYEVRLRIADNLHLRPGNLVSLPVAFALADFSRETHAIGLGRRASEENTLGIGLNVSMHGNRLQGLPAPEDGSEAVSLEFARQHFWGPVLLWENPAPQSEFPAQAVNMSLGEYPFLAIEFAWDGNRYLQVFPKGTASHLTVGANMRPIRSTDSGISFFSAPEGSMFVPTRIYGL